MYRALSMQEIDIMKAAGCESTGWDQIQVKEDFDPSRVRRTVFSGPIRLGSCTGSVTLSGGFECPTGIYDAVLHHVTVGDDVLISKIDQYIANYIIEDHAVIYEVNSLIVKDTSSFGNGIRAAVINEGGGREVTIYDGLPSHIAYLMALYRFKPKLMEQLEHLAALHTASVTSSMGTIGTHARLLGCGPLHDVRVGPWARLEGVAKLSNGTVNSCEEDPAIIGFDVVAEDFIMAEGAKVTDGVIIDKCYIGQATELSKQYSAENSIFFANCAGFHGEACSVFAGPYTVTHHKSTLLIAVLVSFLNAGSGSNQSNHMYKLGPNHQGIIERGSKTASDSYMLFPMHVGAFSVIMGRHYTNSDTSEFPFSYLIEQGGESLLIPAVNIRSVGTVRDSRKWPKRDRRKGPDKHDLITYNLLTPYTVQHVMRGQKKLLHIQLQAGHSSINYFYNGVRISKSALEKGVELYELAIRRYLGNIVVNQLLECDCTSDEEVLSALTPRSPIGSGEWIDVSGLLVPKDEFDLLIADIESGVLDSLTAIHARLATLHDLFHTYELSWVMARICEKKHKPQNELTIGDIRDMVSHWIAAVTELDTLRARDAEKEFAQTAKVGYGLNGSHEERDHEYRVLHGIAAENDFILDLHERLAVKTATSTRLLKELSRGE
ncbi:MAG: DUF4954 family protein [Spirochaetia bacterium]|nr:DUF4954 family protein [Spirochaetia bacterium]